MHHKRPYRFFHLLGNAGNHHASVGMTDQNNVIQLLPLHLIGDIKNVGIEIDVGLQQMGAFANSGQGRREYLMSALAE